MMPEKKEITYEELMSIHRQESKQQFLAKVPSDFYALVSKYLDALETRCSDESEKNSDISGMLLNQLKRAQEKSVEIYELRMRKIALMAMTSAFGASSRLENSTPEEREAFDSLKNFFTEHHSSVFKSAPDIRGIEPAEPKSEEESETKVEKAESPEQKEEPAGSEGGDTVIIKILENLPAFAGADRNYQLMKEDVISLPKNIAEILVRHNKAVEIKHSI